MSGIGVGEILHVRPDKRPAGFSDHGPEGKHLKVDNGEIETGDENIEESGEELKDESSVKKLISRLEKKWLVNQELRVKHPNQPEKFMESEIELNLAIQELHALATMPSFYALLTELNAIDRILSCIAHDNTDISVAGINLLQELTDIDTLTESEEGANALIDSLIESQVVGILVQNLERLRSTVKDEADGIQNTFAIVENLIEFKPDVCDMACEQGLLVWILKRMRSKVPFDGIKLYSSEILAVLVQQNENCRKKIGEKILGDHDGIDLLLQQLAVYKRHNPDSQSEQEFMENLFSVLCASLLYEPNRKLFLQGEGLQLMNLMLREKRMSRASALRVLNYATTGAASRDNCDKFVEILGLRTLFPLFLKTPAKNQRKGYTTEEHEEHVAAVIASLLCHCSDNQKQRVLRKFTESNFVKVDRLMELHFKYMKRVQTFDRTHEAEEEEDEDELYMQRLDSGLFTLQTVDYIVAELYLSDVTQFRQRIDEIIRLRGASMQQIKNTLSEYHSHIDEDERDADEKGRTSMRDKIGSFLDSL